MYNISTI